MVRNGEVKPEQCDDGADQPLGLPQRQAKDRAQRQRGGDRQCRTSRTGGASGDPVRQAGQEFPFHILLAVILIWWT
jgi:hypothetical protein